MSEHRATIRWSRGDQVFSDNRYSRAHEWRFDGGLSVPGSPSPHVVPPPMSSPEAVDPEEAFVAALSSCHMLWFLDLARQRGLVVERYEDEAVGFMARKAAGRYWIERVELNPRIDWQGDAPDAAALAALHEEAHARCFIANSVTSEVVTNLPG